MPDRAVVAVLLLAATTLCLGCETIAPGRPVVSRNDLPTLLRPVPPNESPRARSSADAEVEAVPVVHRALDDQPSTLTGAPDDNGGPIGTEEATPADDAGLPIAPGRGEIHTWGHTTELLETLPPPEGAVTATLPEIEVPEPDAVTPSLPPLPAPTESLDTAADRSRREPDVVLPQLPVPVGPAALPPSGIFADRASEHRIAVGDELAIAFPHLPTFNQTVMVQEDGRITLPLIEPVMAAGRTPRELQEELSRRYRPLRYTPLPARNGTVEKKYLVSTGDRLEVRFDTVEPGSDLRQLSDTATVRPDGKISLPLIGTVAAEGKTPEELEAELARRYRRFYKEAEPVLVVREFTNNQVLIDGRLTRPGMKNIDDVVVLTKKYERMLYVAGEVNRPGFVRMAGPMTVSQAIIAAGGCKRTAELRTIAMFRRGPGNQPLTTTLNLRGRWRPDKKDAPIEDLPCRSGDVIIVPKTHIARVTDTLDQYVYQLIPMTRNTQFQYIYQTGAAVGVFGF